MYTADALKQLYSSYIQSVDFHGASLRLHTNVPINKLKKAELTHIMAAVLANAAAFQLFFKSLPPAVQSVFQELVWQKGERDVEFLEKEYNVRIVKAGEYGRGNVQDLENAYALFRVRSNTTGVRTAKVRAINIFSRFRMNSDPSLKRICRCQRA
jgi:hypothetical protein